ncbi:UNVERIFIED_CONTAM: hypothetical protein HDU68_009648, partial [Siphonaria sp. JEL0065]
PSDTANGIVAKSESTFNVWNCNNAPNVPGTIKVTFPTQPKYCAGDIINYSVSLDSVPLSDPAFGPTVVRGETQPAQEPTFDRGQFGASSNVFAPVVLSSLPSPTNITGKFTIPISFSDFYFKVEANYFGANYTGGAAANPSNFANGVSTKFNVGDVYACGAPTTAAPVSTSVVAPTSKSGAEKIVVFGAGLVGAFLALF